MEGGRGFVQPADERGQRWIEDAVREGLADHLLYVTTTKYPGWLSAPHDPYVYLDGVKVGEGEPWWKRGC